MYGCDIGVFVLSMRSMGANMNLTLIRTYEWTQTLIQVFFNRRSKLKTSPSIGGPGFFHLPYQKCSTLPLSGRVLGPTIHAFFG